MAEIIRRIPITLELAALAGLIAILSGIPLGILAAVRRGTFAGLHRQHRRVSSGCRSRPSGSAWS